MTDDKQRLRELADFLRTRRARLTPKEVGLPSGSRRRTPGLRREEVAQMANVSTTWYTFLEQGRDVRVSFQVLEAIARTLQLTADERAHLFMLALQQMPPDTSPQKEAVSSAIQRVVDSFAAGPAYVTGYQFDVLAWNHSACVLFGDYNLMTSRERNFVWYFFTNAAHRLMLVDWEAHAQLMLAKFRCVCGRYIGDERLAELAEDLQRLCPEFRQWWPRHDVQGRPEGLKEYEHPLVGRLVFEYTLFQVTAMPELTLAVYTPLPESGTPEKFQKLKALHRGVESEHSQSLLTL